jgi:hypothetical protein
MIKGLTLHAPLPLQCQDHLCPYWRDVCTQKATPGPLRWVTLFLATGVLTVLLRSWALFFEVIQVRSELLG